MRQAGSIRADKDWGLVERPRQDDLIPRRRVPSGPTRIGQANGRVLQKPSVLMIGETGHLQQGLAARLRIAGCRVVTPADRRAGVASAVEAEPDLVLLDWDLPDADALDVCREIRRRLQPRRLPVFLLTPEHPLGAGNPVMRGAARELFVPRSGLDRRPTAEPSSNAGMRMLRRGDMS